MAELPPPNLPVPPALTYLLHQFQQAGIRYYLYGEVVEAGLVFVDIDRNLTKHLDPKNMPEEWSLISAHFLSQRALGQGNEDPIAHGDYLAEAIVIAYGNKEAENFENFRALCEQVRYLKQFAPSRLIYHSLQPPEPMQIQAMIQMLLQR